MATGVQIASFPYAGTAILNEVFGGYQAPSSVQIQRLQVTSRVPAVGGNVVFELVDENGTSYGREITLAASTKFQNTGLSAPLTLAKDAQVFAKITEVDLGVAQDFNLVLIGATAQAPSAPLCSCCCC